MMVARLPKDDDPPEVVIACTLKERATLIQALEIAVEQCPRKGSFRRMLAGLKQAEADEESAG